MFAAAGRSAWAVGACAVGSVVTCCRAVRAGVFVAWLVGVASVGLSASAQATRAAISSVASMVRVMGVRRDMVVSPLLDGYATAGHLRNVGLLVSEAA